MYHSITLIGHLTADPVMRFTPEGKAVTNFGLAINDGYGDNKKTIWTRVSVWEKLAETCNNALKKGSKVHVVGRLQHVDGNPRVYESQGEHRATFEIVANVVTFLTPKDAAYNTGEELEF